MMDYKDSRLYKNHGKSIEITGLSFKQLRNNISESMHINPSKLGRNDNALFDWDAVSSHHVFFYDFPNNEKTIADLFKKSELTKNGDVLIQRQSDLPVIKTGNLYFIENWYDLTRGIVGLGSIVVTENYKLLLEFTDDAKYLLHSNFSINLLQ